MPTVTDAITTTDGICPVKFYTPDDRRGPWPGITMYPDAGGVRPAFHAMAARLAGLGYAVLLPDVYYRSGPWAPFDMRTVFDDEIERQRIISMVTAITPEVMTSDAGTFFDYLKARPETAGERFGTIGYCMGGLTSLVVAGRVPDRVGAAMSFHGGGLVGTGPESPHRLVDRIRAAVYVGAAQNDPAYTQEQSAVLDSALNGAHVEYLIEWYPAAHGFAVADNPTYDRAAAERHWQATEAFLAEHSGR